MPQDPVYEKLRIDVSKFEHEEEQARSVFDAARSRTARSKQLLESYAKLHEIVLAHEEADPIDENEAAGDLAGLSTVGAMAVVLSETPDTNVNAIELAETMLARGWVSTAAKPTDTLRMAVQRAHRPGATASADELRVRREKRAHYKYVATQPAVSVTTLADGATVKSDLNDNGGFVFATKEVSS